jgi:glycosyltransferase involved in cell wall biosynthesis
MRKVVHLIYNLGLGGAERQLFELATRLPRDRFKTTVVRFKPTGEYAQRLEQAGVPVITIGKTRAIDLAFLVELRSVLRRLRPDILHCWMISANTWGCLTAPLAGGDTVVITAERNAYPELPDWKQRLLRWQAGRSVVMLGNSKEVTASLTRYGVPAEKLQVIENGIDFARFDVPVDRVAVLKREGLDPTLPLVLTIGRLNRQKDHKTFIAAALNLLSAGVKAQFAILGEGPLLSETRELISSSGYPDGIRLLEARPAVEDVLLACDVFTLPSLHEGFPNVLAEALGAGKAVVATAVSGSTDMVEEGVTGALIPVGDSAALAAAIQRYLDDPALAVAHGNAGRDFMRANYSVERMVQRYCELYERIRPQGPYARDEAD